MRGTPAASSPLPRVDQLVRSAVEHQQTARETGDTSYYRRSELVLQRALGISPNDPDALAALGSLQLARHRFREALSTGRRLQVLAPDDDAAHGIVGDALLELGRYPEAFRAFDRMAALKPSVGSYSRISYARELLGRPQASLEAMELAVDATAGKGEPAAWTRVQLGKLHFSLGRLDAAANEYRLALALFPGYVHALDALAQVEAARGRLARAIELERRATERNPLPQFVGFLGDLYRTQGREQLAREQYALVAAIERILRRERRQDGSRDSTLRRRPRPPARVGSLARPQRAARAPERPGRRRPLVGARAHRPLRRGAALLEARASARHARCAHVLPPRHDRALPRARRRGAALVPQSGRDQPALLAPVEPRRAKAGGVKRLALLVVCLAALAAPAASLAHPLGNFTVNRFAAVELAGDSVYVRYALDLAEIPTFQERARAERPGFARSLARKLELRLDGRRTPLDVVAARTRLRPGAGGLKTLRFDAVYRARGRGSRLELRDRNYPSRLGWREIVVRARDGAELRSASVPADSTSDELRAYPDDLLSEPLDVKRATAEFALGDARAVPPRLAGAPDVERSDGGFESLVDGELTAGVIAVSLLVALFWGAAHALTPGHGKAIVAAYLVGTRGTARHALLLGLVVTVTHTLGVFALGLVTLSLSEFIVPETLYPWMNLVSALLVVGVGVAVLRSRARDLRHRRPTPTPTPTPTVTTTITTMARPRTTGSAGCSRSASRAACCPARPRSSSFWPRSRSTASVSG